MDQVISLYKEEISAYQQQIEDLKQRNHDSDQRNATLIDKIRNLEDLIEKANVANRDLNLAFEHVHHENARLQAKANNQEALVPSIGNSKQIAEVDSGKDELAAESLVWMSERDQFKQRNKFLERECQRYNRDNMHLGKQVRHLLRTLEEERGMIIRQQSQVPPEQNQMICAADVIDKHLITFESIEELQQQNQKLLSLVKDLSEEQEAREVVAESEEVKRLTTDLQELKQQLDTIKSDREKILTALKTIHKERDLFKILLCKTRQVEHLTPEIFQRMVSVACASGPAITGPDSSIMEREAHVEDLKRMVTKLEHNLEDIKKELSDSRAASAAEIALKNQLLETAHLKILEVTKSLESSKECNDLLNENIKALTQEFDDVRTKCQKMTLDLEMSNQKFEEAEGKIKEVERQLDMERKNTQQALIDASRLAEQNQQILHSFESEKHTRKEELASLFEEFQKKHELRLGREIELKQHIDRLHNDLREMQHQRNLERERRILLDRLYHRQPLNGQTTKSNRPIRLKKSKLLNRTQETILEKSRLNNVSHTHDHVMKDNSPPKRINHVEELNNVGLVNNIGAADNTGEVNNLDEMKNIEEMNDANRFGDLEELSNPDDMGNMGDLDNMDELRNMEVLETMEVLKNVDELTYTEEHKADGDEERSLEEPGPNSTEQKFIKLKRRKFD